MLEYRGWINIRGQAYFVEDDNMDEIILHHILNFLWSSLQMWLKDLMELYICMMMKLKISLKTNLKYLYLSVEELLNRQIHSCHLISQRLRIYQWSNAPKTP